MADTDITDSVNASNTIQARFAFGLQNGEKRVQPNELDRWLLLGNVKPRDAALVLCLHDPIYDCGKTPALFLTEIKARDFEWLLKAFEDVAESEKRSSSVRARTLLDWRDIARNKKLKYHSWFDQHELPTILIAEVETPANPEAPESAEIADTTGMPAWQAAILESWKELFDKHGNAITARQVMAWCKSSGPRDVFGCKQTNNRESMQWIDGSAGNVHSVTLARLGTVLSEWRKSKKIPPRK